MLRKTLVVAAFTCAALVGCDESGFGPQIAGSAHSQDRSAELRAVCTGQGFQPGTSLYRNCLVKEADARQPEGGYASYFDKPGMRYDENGHLVDAGGYLIDRNGRRIGGKGHWVAGPRDDVVPPGTHVDPSGHAITPPPANGIGVPEGEVVPQRRGSHGTVTNCNGFSGAAGEQSSCAITRQMSVREAEAAHRASEVKFQAQLREACSAYGLPAGTQPYNDCLARESHERRP